MAIRSHNSWTAPTILLLFLLSLLKMTSGNTTLFYTDEIRSLSELPMTKLIQIKTSFVDETDPDEDDDGNIEAYGRTLSSLPMALPLKRIGKKPIRRYEDHYDEKGKDSKISKIFQLAVTSLSFLAFGGYLLTLIITALRRNAGTSGNGNVIVLSNLQGSQGLQGLQNLQNLQGYIRPKRNVREMDPTENDFEIEKLYQGMIMLCQSYAMHD